MAPFSKNRSCDFGSCLLASAPERWNSIIQFRPLGTRLSGSVYSPCLSPWETSARGSQGTAYGAGMDRRAGHKKVWAAHFHAGHSGHFGFLAKPYMSRSGRYESVLIRIQYTHARGASPSFSAAVPHPPTLRHSRAARIHALRSTRRALCATCTNSSWVYCRHAP